jgi:MoaA/NifB/PqqE/SkfB family radical SAM enzyme
LITNAIVLNDLGICQRFKESGIFDFLISIHALGPTYDQIVGVNGSSNRQMQALDNLRKLEIPFRFNTVLTIEALPMLDDIATVAIEKGARVVNFIAYNHFADQSVGKRSKSSIPRYRQIAASLLPVIDRLSENGIEVNVRYLPFCIFPAEYRRYVQNFQQIIFDVHEWESAGETWTGKPSQRISSHPLSEPTDFYKELIKIRHRYFLSENGKAKVKNDWFRNYMEHELERMICESRKSRLLLAVFGNLELGKMVFETINKSTTYKDRIDCVGFISTPAYHQADQWEGYAWYRDDWLDDHPVDMIINASDAYKEEINNILAEKGLAGKTICIFDALKRQEKEYIPSFYIPELGQIQGFDKKLYAYKEYRALMAKILHPFKKRDKCDLCCAIGICDGFHKDYADFIGFEEAKPIGGGQVIYDPRHYMQSQLKVLEKEELSTAFSIAGDSNTDGLVR